MVYITKRYPSPRTYDTSIGKVMGYLAELDFYLEHEQTCLKIASLFSPINFFPLYYLKDWLINLHRRIYEDNYQKVYDQGADRGNEINRQILGWLDDLKGDAYKKIDDAKRYLYDLINTVNSKLKILNKDVINFEADINKLIADFNAKVNDAIKKVNSVIDTMNRLSEQARAKFDEFEKSLTDQYNVFKTRFEKHDSYISDLYERVKDLEAKVGLPPKEYKEKSIWETLRELLK